ncbi:polysaccharide biosynthesis/export family protein [bacterium]|nr:polysaccharide biosynthesis/export family protein [bacterium]MCI0602764.1 polysaccharide biosynthesis/export family protein [bacterium]
MKKLAFFFALFLSTYLFAQQVGTITKISLKPESDRFNVFITGEGKLECNTLIMDNPPRIALDFPNVKNALYPNIIEADENTYVHRVRTSLYAKGRDTISRITVDLKNRLDYSVYKTKDGIVLALSLAATKPVKTDSKTPAAKTKTPPPTTSTPAPAPVQVFKTPPAPVGIQDIVIGPEDLLEVAVFELPQFNTTARVQGDGTITMPLIGSIEVRGLKKKDVEQKIATALQEKYVNNANVSVNVKEYKSRQVSLLGEVKQPGAYYVMSQRTLLQLLSEAGGLSPNAGSKCYVFRPGSPKIEINLRDLMINGNQELNIPIYPGDVVNVPVEMKITIYVFGAVRNPGAVQLSSATPITLMSAIAAAGGPSESAKQSDIRIKRKNSVGAENVIKANLKDILKGKVEDILLFEGDVVTVPESFF